jgi:putative phosphonate metabolism protein
MPAAADEAAPVNPRFAIYFVPAADSALYRFGAAVLGYDCYTGGDVGFPRPLPIEQSAWRNLTEEPRRYGFHATLKAPFHLANPAAESDLADQFQAFCRFVDPVPAFEPMVASLQGFVAIVPTVTQAAIERLATACVTAFDRFRAPLSAADRNRRTVGLSERQIGHLDRWGYPYVFEDFRLHLTLTGRLAGGEHGAVLSWLQDGFAAAHGARPVVIDRIALVRQDRPDARFRVMRDAAIGTGR